jgi:hypothetical protein
MRVRARKAAEVASKSEEIGCEQIKSQEGASEMQIQAKQPSKGRRSRMFWCV